MLPATIVREEKFYSKLDVIIPEVNSRVISMDSIKKKKYLELTEKIVKQVISELKRTDPVFNCLFKEVGYVGSYYDGLRVGEATEFDLNIILKIPCNYDKIKIENGRSGYVKLNVQNAINDQKLNKLPNPNVWIKWVDNGYLLHDKILSWWQSALTKVLQTCDKPFLLNDVPVYISFRRSGPAFTLNIKNDTIPANIDVDLVTVIKFPPSVKPPSPIRWTDPEKPWMVVPKNPFAVADYTLWRLSFPEQEKQIMSSKYHLKFINRLVKKFRDQQGLNMPSYYIKTLFLWEEIKQQHNKHFWNQRVGYLFVYMLGQLQEALRKQELKFYWHKKLNLFSTLEKNNMFSMYGHITNLIKKINRLIEENDDIGLMRLIYQIFGVPETEKNRM